MTKEKKNISGRDGRGGRSEGSREEGKKAGSYISNIT